MGFPTTISPVPLVVISAFLKRHWVGAEALRYTVKVTVDALPTQVRVLVEASQVTVPSEAFTSPKVKDEVLPPSTIWVIAVVQVMVIVLPSYFSALSF